jgi:beta-glucosidase
VKVTVRNDGARAAEEVVQLYVHDRVASVTRPVRELKAFRKVAVPAHGAAEVALTLRAADLGFLGADSRLRLEPGSFDLWVGPSAQEGLAASFTLTA